NDSNWKVDELVRVPAAAHGYIDQQSGKQENSVRRRYSDFELLHAHFVRVYPYSIIPPIPSKQSLNGQAEGSHIVDQRVRFFCNFLRHSLSHPVLYADHVLHLFISNPDASWRAEVIKYNPVEPRPFTKIPASVGKPFEELLLMLLHFEEACKTLEISQKSVLRKLQEILRGLESLSTAFNGFSLEYAELVETLDSLGEIYDGNATSFGDIVLNQQITCDLIHEFSQYIVAIRRAARNVAAHAVQWEMLTEKLSHLRSNALQQGSDGVLENLEAGEQNLAKEVHEEKELLWEQLSIWLKRLTASWNQILVRVAESEKYYIQRGFALWKDAEVAH
ncbi:hypothetical protein PSACC_00077, partial [Paramicrosporidium saccamoebae]